jgi:hypothetical protein
MTNSPLLPALSLTAALALQAGGALAQTPAGAGPVAPPVATVATAPAAAAPPVAAARRVEDVAVSDEPADGTLVRMGRSEVVIRAPMELVVRQMTDFAHYNEFLPHVRESRVVRRNRGATDVYMQVPLGGSLGVIWALLRLDSRRTPDRFVLDGQAVDSNMDRFETHTVIERVAGDPAATRLTFRMLALPRLPFPSSVFTREMRDATRTITQNLRARVERAAALEPVRAVAAPAAAPAAPANATSQR